MTSGGRHSTLLRIVAGTLAVFFCVFVVLGTWQVKRRAWKLDLISRVEHRVHTPPTALPEPSAWPHVTAAGDEYRHVTVSGTFLDSSQTLVQAVTELGSGFWVLTPVRRPDGLIVLVNRGFVATEDRNRVSPERIGSISGLVRMSEPGGAFLRDNDPAGNRWFSRDIQAIAAARGLTGVAPFFVDADADPNTPGGDRAGSVYVTPVGGLTVIRFHNNHLVYAITWYTLAIMTAVALWIGIRNESHA